MSRNFHMRPYKHLSYSLNTYEIWIHLQRDGVQSINMMDIHVNVYSVSQFNTILV